MLRRHIVRAMIHAAPLALLLAARPAAPQSFSKVTSGNAIATDPVPASAAYAGVAWGDYDDDGDQDLYIVQQGLYRNNGAGSFSKLAAIPADHSLALGCSWGDVDNDGDLDLFVAGGPPGGSVFYRNDGGNVFTRVVTGDIGDAVANQGWSAAWGDYDLDGLLDLAVAAANGFANITTPNHLLHNLGAATFERLDTTAVSMTTGTYTVPCWNDVDDDGDPDLFIASGPVDGTTAPDFLYANNRTAPGQTEFSRITTGALATDPHDGQLYNWVDIDSDGDLDVYVTNYGGPSSGLPNDLYRNDGGTFVRLTSAQAGPIVSDAGHSMASVWADFDNDGDMDCVVANDGPELTQHYSNDGTGFFTSLTGSALRTVGPHYGAGAADYDADGDMDLYIHGTTGTRGLFRNNSNPASPNGWLDVHCVGSVSNRAAIGSRVWVRATIGGVSRILVQQISAQNSFDGHGSFDPHFGLGSAAVVEDVTVRFPSGIQRTVSDVAIRQRITVTEDVPTSVLPEPPGDSPRIEWLGANPVGARLRLALTLPAAGDARLGLLDVSGRSVLSRELRGVGAGRHLVDLGSSAALDPGVYWLRVDAGGTRRSVRIVVVR